MQASAITSGGAKGPAKRGVGRTFGVPPDARKSLNISVLKWMHRSFSLFNLFYGVFLQAMRAG